jgi:hypothetical protein
LQSTCARRRAPPQPCAASPGDRHRPRAARSAARRSAATLILVVREKKLACLPVIGRETGLRIHPDRAPLFLAGLPTQFVCRRRPTSTVREIGGTQPEDFERIVHRCVSQSAFAKRTIGHTATAALNPARAMLITAPDVDALAKKLGIPQITHGNPAADPLSWQVSHPGGDEEPDPTHTGQSRLS